MAAIDSLGVAIWYLLRVLIDVKEKSERVIDRENSQVSILRAVITACKIKNIYCFTANSVDCMTVVCVPQETVYHYGLVEKVQYHHYTPGDVFQSQGENKAAL